MNAKRLLFFCGLLFWSAAASATSTINPAVPQSGQPYTSSPIRNNFQASANDINALQNCNRGATAPSAPNSGYCWLDTSAGSTWTYRFYDGVTQAWVPVFSIDSINSLLVPPIGGGVAPDLLSATTTDLGTVPEASVYVTGANTIQSFGSSTPTGGLKVILFTGAATLVNNSVSLILPGGANITQVAGDSAVALALGGGNWQVLFDSHLLGPGVAPAFVSNTAALEAACTQSSGCPAGDQVFVNGVFRQGFLTPGDAPVLAFNKPLVKAACSLNSGAGDGGSQVPSADGNCWLANFPNGMLDIREFGAVPDGVTTNDAVMVSALNAAEAINACTYVPSTLDGFAFQSEVDITPFHCLKGDRFQGFNLNTPEPGFTSSMLLFPHDSNGVVVLGGGGTGDFDVENLSIRGNAQASTSTNQTRGLYLYRAVEGVVDNIFIQNFVIGGSVTAPSGRIDWNNVYVNDQNSPYPNIINNYPLIGWQFDNTGFPTAAVPASDFIGGETRSMAWTALANGNGTGTQTAFDITLPTAGTQGVPPVLWAATGIYVTVGSSNPQVGQTCGVNYTIYDITTSGGGGFGGIPLFCAYIAATTTAGNPEVTVSSTAGLQAGNNIAVFADHGIEPATKVQSIVDGTHLMLTIAPIDTGTINLVLTQINVGSVGGSNACVYLSPPTCGHVLEVRLNSAPPPGTGNVVLRWIDPRGYAAVYALATSDYLKIEPTLVGGYWFGIRHEGVNNSGLTFRPTYIELVEQCASIEADQSGTAMIAGDVLDFHRVIMPMIPNCPGYVAPAASKIIENYNNVATYSNGASLGEYYLANMTGAQADATGDGTGYQIVFDTIQTDRATDSFYNNNTGIFNANVTGQYAFTGTVELTGLVAGETVLFDVSTTQHDFLYNYPITATGPITQSFSLNTLDAPMTAGDIAKVFVTVSGGSKTVGVQGGTTMVTYWAGRQIP
jgi:hypothetical protein